jgi:hypothetical protein
MMSEKRRFTTGEWRVEPKRGLENYGIVFDDGESMGIGWLADVGINPDDADADAQVMAASKALYLALAAVLHSIDAHSRLVMLGEAYGLVNEAAIEAARAALALVERRV